MEATWARFDDGRLHFQHGPIDLIIGADGDADAVAAAEAAAWRRFREVLTELVAELGVLRRAVGPASSAQGPVARRMLEACRPFAAPPYRLFITPMAAVAGAVADEIAAPFRREGIRRAYVNNGGDIAVVLAPGTRFDVGVVEHPGRPAPAASIRVEADSGIGGIATSGWRGRSFSLGIADSATVVACGAAQADAAATLVANAVDAQHPSIRRAPADSLKDDSDLGDRAVTVGVGPLPHDVVQDALDRGIEFARDVCRQGLIIGAWITLQGSTRAVGQESAMIHPAAMRA